MVVAPRFWQTRDPEGDPGPLDAERAGSPRRGRTLRVDDGAARRQPPGAVPAVTFSFNLAPGVALGDASAPSRPPPASSACPRACAQLPGTARLQASLANEPLLILAALVTVYIVSASSTRATSTPHILSTLPSAGVGAILALRSVHDLSMIALIGIILLIGM